MIRSGLKPNAFTSEQDLIEDVSIRMLDVFTGDIARPVEDEGYGGSCYGDDRGVAVSASSGIGYLYPEIRAYGESAGGKGAAGGPGDGVGSVTAGPVYHW